MWENSQRCSIRSESYQPTLSNSNPLVLRCNSLRPQNRTGRASKFETKWSRKASSIQRQFWIRRPIGREGSILTKRMEIRPWKSSENRRSPQRPAKALPRRSIIRPKSQIRATLPLDWICSCKTKSFRRNNTSKNCFIWSFRGNTIDKNCVI